MKYKIVIIKEDKNILEGFSDYKWAKAVGCTPMYVNFVRREKTVATSKFYAALKKARKYLTRYGI